MKFLFWVILLSSQFSLASNPHLCEETFIKIPKAILAAESKMLLESMNARQSEFKLSVLFEQDPELKAKIQRALVKIYTDYAKRYGRHPSQLRELEEFAKIEARSLDGFLGPHLVFGDLLHLKMAAIGGAPKIFKKVIDPRFNDEKALERLKEALLKSSGFLIVNAIAEVPVSEHFLESLKLFARARNFAILVMPSLNITTGLDPKLTDDPELHIVTNTVQLSPFLRIDNIGLMPKLKDPTAGLDGYGPRGQSVIVGAPQVRLRPVATIDNDNNPHFVISPGAVTLPIYGARLPISDRTGRLAEKSQHNMAVLILEKSLGTTSEHLPPNSQQTGFFHYRHAHYLQDVGFVDKGVLYARGGYRKTRSEAIVLPDVHVGMSEPIFLSRIETLVKELHPGYLVLHDVFNGHSISHHDSKNLVSQARAFSRGRLDLATELREVATFINSLLQTDPSLEIRIVISNHDLWLDRWLESFAFKDETHNRALGLELAAAKVRGENVFKFALMKFGLEYPKRVIFVDQGAAEEKGVQLGQHGHQGANGARGSLVQMKRAVDKAAFGHTHKTEIWGHVVNVGTGSVLRPGYTGNGPSSWSHSVTVIYEQGVQEVFILREGEWWSDTSVIDSRHFFYPGYPQIEPLRDPSIGQQIDQWTHMAK